MAAFAWVPKNIDHIARHGVEPHEAEQVVRHARRPYPQYIGDSKWLVRGQTDAGRYLQVIYVLGIDATDLDYALMDVSIMDDPDLFYVIHAMPLDARRKRNYRRKKP